MTEQEKAFRKAALQQAEERQQLLADRRAEEQAAWQNKQAAQAQALEEATKTSRLTTGAPLSSTARSNILRGFYNTPNELAQQEQQRKDEAGRANAEYTARRLSGVPEMQEQYRATYGQPMPQASIDAVRAYYPDLIPRFAGEAALNIAPFLPAPEQESENIDMSRVYPVITEDQASEDERLAPVLQGIQESQASQPTSEQQSMPSSQASVTSEQPANVDKWTQAADTLLNSILNPQQQQQDPVVQNAIQLITDRLSAPAQTSAYDQIMQDRTLAALQNADLRTQELEAQRSMNPLDYLSWGLGNVVSPIVGRPTTTREAFMDRKYAPQQQDIDQDYARSTGQAQTLGQLAGDDSKNASDQIRGLSDLLQLRSAATAQAQQQPAAQLRNLMLAKELVDLPARQQLEMQLNELRKDLTEQQIRALRVATDQAENPPPEKENAAAMFASMIAEEIARRRGLNNKELVDAETMKVD